MIGTIDYEYSSHRRMKTYVWKGFPAQALLTLTALTSAYSIYDAIQAGSLLYGLVTSADDYAKTLADRCTRCYGNFVGFTWDGASCIIIGQIASTSSHQAPGCGDGVYQIAVPQNPDTCG